MLYEPCGCTGGGKRPLLTKRHQPPIFSMGMEQLGWFCSERPMPITLLGAWRLPREMVKAAIAFEFGLHL